MRYRRQKGFSTRDNPETPPKIQLIGNPTLDRRLQYVRNIEELYGDNINDKTIKVIKAHALGEGKVKIYTRRIYRRYNKKTFFLFN